ncbi:MAG: FtsX-like permease family protein [Bacteroidales bacterium]|nr:FtsX-like permease family protein [Bacteroidales bacterium]
MMFLKEILHRKLSFIFTLAGVLAAVTLVVSFYTLTKATWNETRLLTRDMGFNLRIIPTQTNMDEFWINGYSENIMPEQFLQRLVDQNSVNYAHLTASLHKQISWENQKVILSGISPDEIEPGGARKSKMIFAIPSGTVILGFEVANKASIQRGDSIQVLNTAYLVDKILAETGSLDDIRIYFDLNELQTLLNMPGMINEIMALNCMCSTKGDNPLETLRTELGNIIPEAKVVMNSTIAVARERQRKMGDKYFSMLVPLFLIICMLWVAISILNNVNHRLQEIGILRALGFGSGRIAIIFFVRAALAGFLGAILGYYLGTEIAKSFGPDIFKVAPNSVKELPVLLFWSVLIAPILACVSASIPITWALSRDPAVTLKQD